MADRSAAVGYSRQPVRILTVVFVVFFVTLTSAQSAPGPWSMAKLPDTGQSVKYARTPGEDADVTINPMSFKLNGDGTVTDLVTTLMWQQTDGGEMTWDNARAYPKTLTTGGYADWRLPTSHELFSILNHGRNPALNPEVFPRTDAEYWWSSETLPNDPNRVWVTNSGGGIGPHPRNETISAGGPKRYHTRCVRDIAPRKPAPARRFAPNGDHTITDLATGLIWQQDEGPADMTWEDGLAYARALDLGGHKDWRLPNIKELQSLNDETRANPSINREAFPGAQATEYWSSTTLFGRDSGRAWIIDFRLGIGSYTDKTAVRRVRCVRGGA